jgi:hypothetical protein
MAQFTPYLISDLTEGKVTRRDRWLLPPDGFAELFNCHLKRGKLEKRYGRSKLGQIVKVDTATQNPTLQTNPVMGVFNHLSGNTQELIVFDKERMNTFVSSKVSGVILLSVADVGGAPNVVRFTVATGHGLAADDIVTISNTTNYDGTYRVEAKAGTTFDIESAYVAETMGTTSQVNQEQFIDASKHRIRFNFAAQSGYTPANGDTIEQAVSGATGTVDVITVDYGTFGGADAVGTIIFQRGTVTGTFNGTGQLFESGTPANIVGDAVSAGNDSNWTGDNTDSFWTENWTLGGASKTFITNNNDPIEIYDGTNLTQLFIDIGTDGNRAGQNDVNSALLIFVVKERIVIFSTNESGTDYKQRARWSTVKDPQSWPTANSKDAPTEDYIVSADFLGDDLYVWFENSVWRFVWTGDSADPFEWQRVSAQDGTIAQMSLTTLNNLQTAIGPTKILANNGNSVSHIDQKIPDVVLEWNPDSAPYSVSAVLEEERHKYFTYARPESATNGDGNQYPDRALILNYEDRNWAVHSHDIHSMGYSSLESDVAWDLDEAWEDIDFSWNQLNTVSGFPFTIIGNHAGVLFQLNTGGSDAGTDIEFNATTGRFNPYHNQGQKAKLWKVEFLCTVNPDVSFDVELFLGTDTTKYSTTTITTSAVEGSDEKAWYAAYSGATAGFHSANITNNASSNRPVIHAMRWWFKPAGRVK